MISPQNIAVVSRRFFLSIYRKSASADVMIQYTSNHPQDHKLAAFTYYINRITVLPITEQAERQEWNKILNTLKTVRVI